MVNSLFYQDENGASYFDNYETALVGKLTFNKPSD